MTNPNSTILIQPLSLTIVELTNIKAQIAGLDWAVLLESAGKDHVDSRWSIISAQPVANMVTYQGVSTITQGNKTISDSSDPLAIQQNLRQKLFHNSTIETDLPFTGGVLGYYSYGLGNYFENIQNADKPVTLELPEMAVGFYDWALLIDNENEQNYLVVHKMKQSSASLQALWQQRFAWLKAQNLKTNTENFKLSSSWQANMSKSQYAHKFAKIQEYILSGDCYQVNLAQRFQASYQGDEYQAYQALLAENRPPFAAFMRLPEQAIISLSPERFIKLHNNIVETKPIKGTTPRFNDFLKDQISKQTLLDSEKDRSENLMIVDLLRNDISRVCTAGSVSVPKLFDIESFPAVHHLVSTVVGQLDSIYSSEDLLRACFPGGSITGAPKIRAMEIIAELEPHNRQMYCGSIGYVNGNGQTDTNIAIRTLLCYQGHIYCWAGGGLVADSNVDAEYQECFDKVSKILPCLEILNK
ncbi:aminodeoxychorismate synthase, component I [Psychromonas sp. MB-3u-54]|uniref:aminodeoxychorismate synthase component I n=1 Tax=Psychromonas sp. MB-3u-54 TaxID=2058319 RepID=UPI000C33D63F|nr:aminodeoxychorismate synthase component I [Psychromonas sp. MB-3u-54]PKH01333.1 aminodeoxychorismate synthase, component I [Psychromonas sp. MB-3u-54]